HHEPARTARRARWCSAYVARASTGSAFFYGQLDIGSGQVADRVSNPSGNRRNALEERLQILDLGVHAGHLRELAEAGAAHAALGQLFLVVLPLLEGRRAEDVELPAHLDVCAVAVGALQLLEFRRVCWCHACLLSAWIRHPLVGRLAVAREAHERERHVPAKRLLAALVFDGVVVHLAPVAGELDRRTALRREDPAQL